MHVNDHDRMNAIASMVISGYRRKLRVAYLIVLGLVVLYVFTVLAFIQSMPSDSKGTTIGMAAPVAVFVSRYNAVPKPARRDIVIV